MLQFFLNGGPAMAFVLALGLVGLVSSFRFMRAPDPRRVSAVIALSVATGFASLTAVATDLAAVGHTVATREELHDQMAAVVLQGFSEAMSPAILGGTFLCVTWMLMAVGYRRLAARLPVS